MTSHRLIYEVEDLNIQERRRLLETKSRGIADPLISEVLEACYFKVGLSYNIPWSPRLPDNRKALVLPIYWTWSSVRFLLPLQEPKKEDEILTYGIAEGVISKYLMSLIGYEIDERYNIRLKRNPSSFLY